MLDLHTQEIILEVLEQISEHMESAEDMDDDDRLSASESIIQEVHDKLSLLVDRDG